MDKKIFEIDYNGHTLARVEIIEEIAAPFIKEMVEFWSNWESALDDHGGDYTTLWLKNLAQFILREHRLPTDDEGWARIEDREVVSWANGEKIGIRVAEFNRHDVPLDELEVTQL